MVMLNMAGTRYLVGYLVCDQGFYFLLKAVRRDLWYWLPVYGPIGYFVTCMARTISKAVSDFTGCPFFRVPAELGGIYWIFSMVSAVGVGFVSIPIYFAKTDPSQVIVDEIDLWMFLCSVSAAWLLVFVGFLVTMNGAYRGTFFSFETGVEYTQRKFIDGRTELERIDVMFMNKYLWMSIRPLVREFLFENWERWTVEIPDWFTDNFKENLDDDLVPDGVLEKMKAEGGGERRRSSAFGSIIGGNGGKKSVQQVAPEPPV